MRSKRPLQFLLAGLITGVLTAATLAQQPRDAEKTAAGLSLPQVTQIDENGLKKLLVPNGKPLVINFWATWCDPCRDEFPELVKLNTDLKGKVDMITISLDDLADINTEVPKFLGEMRSEMPSYLLKVSDEDTTMRSVSADWAGGLPFTIVFDKSGKTIYFRQGKVNPDILRAALLKQTSTSAGREP